MCWMGDRWQWLSYGVNTCVCKRTAAALAAIRWHQEMLADSSLSNRSIWGSGSGSGFQLGSSLYDLDNAFRHPIPFLFWECHHVDAHAKHQAAFAKLWLSNERRSLLFNRRINVTNSPV